MLAKALLVTMIIVSGILCSPIWALSFIATKVFPNIGYSTVFIIALFVTVIMSVLNLNKRK